MLSQKPNLIEFSNKGLYCPPGKFYIDPFKPVEKALITHAHGDHARWGMKYYLSHFDSIPIMKVRLGEQNHFEGINYDEEININGVKVSYHPAGHIIGSAQIRLEYKGEVWVVSGDYKLENDGLSPAFEPVPCNTFITESTFGLPIYRWMPQESIFKDINNWWQSNKEKGVTSIILGYSLGKAQRILYNLDKTIGPVYLHGAIYNLNKVLIDAGHPLPDFPKFESGIKKNQFTGAMIVAPPSTAGSPWMRKFQPYSMAVASGWMALRGAKRRKAADNGFILSDHADWPELNIAVKACGAERVFVTHGYTQTFATWLRSQGVEAYTVNSLYENQFGAEEANEADLTEVDEKVEE